MVTALFFSIVKEGGHDEIPMWFCVFPIFFKFQIVVKEFLVCGEHMAKYCVFVIDFGVQWILPTGVYFGVHRQQQPQWGAVYLSKLSEQEHFYKPQKSQFLVLSVWVVAVFHMVSIAENVFCLSSVPCLTQHSARRSKAELNWIGEGQQSHCPIEITVSGKCQVSGAFGRFDLDEWYFGNPLLSWGVQTESDWLCMYEQPHSAWIW